MINPLSPMNENKTQSLWALLVDGPHSAALQGPE
jgi:hypothetical protein